MTSSERKRLAVVFGMVLSGLFCRSGIRAEALSLEADGFHETLPVPTISSFMTVETVLIPRSSVRSEIENVHVCDQPMLCLWTLSRRSRETTLNVSSRKVDSVALSKYVSTLAQTVNRDPKNTVFGETPDKTVTLIKTGQDGLTLDENAATTAIRTAIETGDDTVALPVKTVSPTISSTDPSELGLTSVVAEATTNFRGSPKNRIFNINRALEQFQGVLIAPGENFSFVKQLGEVDGEHGYLPELVIKANKTEPEFGGGICQVSTTVFQTAIKAGLKITARRNHAYPVSYYKPYGMDATVYVPKPDLSFTNNTPGYILILSSVQGTSLTFRFYGTTDGRQVAIDGPHILESNPDGSMKTTFNQKVTDASGNVLINDDFPSNYKSPSLFPHPQDYTVKPTDWSKKQWEDYLAAKAIAATPQPTVTSPTSQAPVSTGN
ncbi:MAG: VanW family protein [Candidatus Moraniibacteriota bacterium]